MDKVAIALANATQTKDLRLGCGVLSEAAEVFEAQFQGCRPLIICDANTWEAAGRRLSELTGWQDKYMFPHKEFHAEWEYVEELEAVAEAWYRVFPNDRAPDGRTVEKVFVYGNHDWQGWL